MRAPQISQSQARARRGLDVHRERIFQAARDAKRREVLDKMRPGDLRGSSTFTMTGWDPSADGGDKLAIALMSRDRIEAAFEALQDGAAGKEPPKIDPDTLYGAHQGPTSAEIAHGEFRATLQRAPSSAHKNAPPPPPPVVAPPKPQSWIDRLIDWSW